jgi:release factor glutamine methyltransferase
VLWRELLQSSAARLQAAGIDNAMFEARLLAAHACELEPGRLVGLARDSVSHDERTRVEAAIGRRAAREPASQILGWREFWSLRFVVTADVLTPRPDSETVIEATLAAIADRQAGLRLLDLGTGSGCLALALLSQLPNATAVAVDISPAALAIAADNAARLGLGERIECRLGNWTDGLAGRFDVVVANPPYIRQADLASLPPEVREHEPRLALDGGSDGLDAYRSILGGLGRLVHSGTALIFEVGMGQAAAVAQMLEKKGFSRIERHRDLAGIERAVGALGGEACG